MLRNFTVPNGLLYDDQSCKINNNQVDIKDYSNELLYEQLVKHVFGLKKYNIHCKAKTVKHKNKQNDIKKTRKKKD